MKALTPEQVKYYKFNGFAFPFPALSEQELVRCRKGVERLERDLGCHIADADPKWRSHGHAHSPWIADLVRHPRILDAIEDVIGPDILVWTTTFFIKEPDSKTFAAWHQDGTYFGFAPNEQVCAWVAITNASREAGCMEHVSFQGRPRQLNHAALGLKNSINRAGQTIMEDFDKSRPVAMALKAGEFSLHHEFAIHRSARNHAMHRRIGIGLNFIPPHIKIEGGSRCMAMLVRGQDRYGHFDLFDPPTVERDTHALDLHQRVTDAYRANYNKQVVRHQQLFAAG